MITSVRFTDSDVRFTNRFIQSTKVRDEAEAGRALYRTFGTAFESDQLFKGVGLASPVNVSTYLVGDNLLAVRVSNAIVGSFMGLSPRCADDP